MKKILVVGDSYADHHEVKTYKADSFPIWPEILANKWDYSLLNEAKCGMGCKGIFNNYIDLTSKIKFDIAIVMWTYVKRIDIEHKPGDYLPLHPDVIETIDKQSKPFKSLELLRYMYLINILSEKLNIPTFQVSGTNTHLDRNILYSPLFDKIDDKNIWGWPFCRQLNGKCLKKELADDELLKFNPEKYGSDGHPNEKGHQKMAQIIGDFIESRIQI